MPIEESVKVKMYEDDEKVLITDGKWNVLESCAAIKKVLQCLPHSWSILNKYPYILLLLMF